MNKFSKVNDKWVIESDSYHKTGSIIEVRTKNGVKTVTIGRCISQPSGVQRRGNYVYEIA